tara:strand:- start:1102 stop:1269 length:168 start_codon:yes stop_codon:yes gene_type:complete
MYKKCRNAYLYKTKNLMNLLKTIAIFAALYVGATILLRVVFDKLYRNIQKRYLTK